MISLLKLSAESSRRIFWRHREADIEAHCQKILDDFCERMNKAVADISKNEPALLKPGWNRGRTLMVSQRDFEKLQP